MRSLLLWLSIFNLLCERKRNEDLPSTKWRTRMNHTTLLMTWFEYQHIFTVLIRNRFFNLNHGSRCWSFIWQYFCWTGRNSTIRWGSTKRPHSWDLHHFTLVRQTKLFKVSLLLKSLCYFVNIWYVMWLDWLLILPTSWKLTALSVVTNWSSFLEKIWVCFFGFLQTMKLTKFLSNFWCI